MTKALRILLVEDHLDTQRLMTRLLERFQFSVQAAGTVQSALALANAASFDLVITDLGLPDGSGLQLMEELKKRFNLPGIALTGYSAEDQSLQANPAVFAEHLTKPVDFQKLVDTIHRVTRTS